MPAPGGYPFPVPALHLDLLFDLEEKSVLVKSRFQSVRCSFCSRIQL